MRLGHLGLFAGLTLAAAAPAARGEAPPKVVAHIAGPDGPWDYASVSTDPHRLLVARGYGVMAVDLDSGVVTEKLLPGQRVHSALPLPFGDLAISTNGDAATAVLFHIGSGQVVATLPTGKKPDGAVYDPATKLVAVMDGASSDITLIDPLAAKVAGAPIPIGGKLEAAVVDGRGALFVNVEDRNELVKVDLRTGKVAARFKLEGCEGPTGLIYSPKSQVMVTACGNGFAKVISPEGRTIAMLKTGEDADAVLYDAARDRALIPSPANGGSLTVTALSGGAPRVISMAATETGARTGAFDPRTGRVYLPAAKRMVKSATGGREVPAPGAFDIVVLETR
ncbi:YncE family protein [Caulobacter sp. S45]|jgi:DNA-binding beta-propeller fold protein YncE|uniref:YncE family protein n=1 Tax=Caulobacter sp. S45 TaxID=1641861 RepID=UPI00131D53EA|nr:YncE family protein [Caulobacter sp. S45]